MEFIYHFYCSFYFLHIILLILDPSRSSLLILDMCNLLILDRLKLGISGASPGFGRGGGKNFFFQIWNFALLGVFVGMLPRENFFKRCVLGCILIRFCLYFFFKNYHFLYKKINILDKLLLWGISHEEIFENMLRLMRFGVYFETKMAIFMTKTIIVYLHSYMLGARGHILYSENFENMVQFGAFWCIF